MFGLISLMSVFTLVMCDIETSVTTTLGTINGRILDSTRHGTNFSVKTFLGIPYAKPPIAERRFKKKEILTQIPDPLDAFDFGPACMQARESSLFNFNFTRMSEDCLFLNVYVPDRSPSDSRGFPVMVFVHGGGFIGDSAESYSGDVITAFNDVIVVTLNYRLNIFGFLSLGVQDGHGNLGLWDQHIAFQWVNRHIGSFGGDNNRVTVFGESAGGQSVLYHTFFSDNRGLFQRVISESGNIPVFPNSRLSFKFNSKSQLNYFTRTLGCERQSLDDSVTCLQSLSTDTIMDSLQTSNALNQPDLMFAPTIDGEIVKTDPANLKDMSNQENLEDFKFYRSLDMLSGFNNREGALFAVLLLPNAGEQFQPSQEQFRAMYIPMGLTVASLQQTPAMADIIWHEYTTWNSNESEVTTVQKQFLEFYLDIIYAIGTLSYAQLHDVKSGNGSTYVYKFSASTTNHLVPMPSWASGANHGDEMAFVFGFNSATKDLFSKSINGNYTEPMDWEYILSNTMMTYWTNFAKSGDPNQPEPVPATWPEYDVDNQRYLELEQNMSAESSKQYLLSGKLNFWLTVYPEVLRATQHIVDKCGVQSCDPSC